MIVSNADLVARLRRSGARRTALFLGAGASMTFGYPLTSELLEKIFERIRKIGFLGALPGDPTGTAPRNRESLASYLAQLLPGKGNPRQTLPLVTALLSLLDHSLATGQSVLARRSVEETRGARRLLERAILEVLADDEEFTPDEMLQLDRFCRFLTDLRAFAPDAPLTIVTTNYDMAADSAAYKCAAVAKDRNGRWNEDHIAKRVDFGFNWYHPERVTETIIRRPQRPVVNLLKLHGSTNWLRCPLCDHVYINPWAAIWHQAYKSQADDHNTCHCTRTRLHAQIVSPSFVREMKEPNLLAVWNEALDGLRTADQWIIVGYSFPDEDLGVRSLFTRAYSSRNRAPKIFVVQRDDRAHERYEAFFDPGALLYATGGLADLLELWGARQRAPTRRARRRRSRAEP